MKILDCEQGSDEWLVARCGSVGASSIADLRAKTKSGWGASRKNLMATLITERLTGKPSSSYTNAAMQWGIDTEPEARDAYAFVHDASITQVGLVLHPLIPGSHASPDGLVGDDGLVEIKCPQTATHIDTLLAQKVDGRYIQQMQWQMACTDRKWCDFVSYDPRLPGEMQLFVQRVPRDDAMIDEITADVVEFICDLDNTIDKLRRMYGAEQSEAA